jgi:hypothetical protein
MISPITIAMTKRPMPPFAALLIPSSISAVILARTFGVPSPGTI